MTATRIFRLTRYDKDTGILTSTLDIFEPKGFSSLEKTYKRDNEAFGLFVEYSTDLDFFNFLRQNGASQVYSNAYKFISDAYNEDFVRANVKFEVISNNTTIFDTNIDFDSFSENLTEGFELGSTTSFFASTQAVSKAVKDLKNIKKQSVKLDALKPIQLREQSISQIFTANINRAFTQIVHPPYYPEVISGTDYDVDTPPITWVQDYPTLQNPISNDPSEIIYIENSEGTITIDFSMRFNGVIDYDTFAPTNIDVILYLRVYDETDTLQSTISNVETFPLRETVGVIDYYDFDIDLSGSFDLQKGWLVRIGLGVENIFGALINTNFYTRDVNSFDNMTFNITKLFKTTKCYGLMLSDAFTQVTQNLGLDIESSWLDDIHGGGSKFITNGRRIFKKDEGLPQSANETDISDWEKDNQLEMKISLDELLRECYKLFGIGYALVGNSIIIEQIGYFFKTDIYTLPNAVSKFERKVWSRYSFQAIETGYDSFKPEEIGVFYEDKEYNSKREYNIKNSSFDKKMNLRSKWIASNFMIEELRRNYTQKNDTQTFIIQLNRTDLTSDKYSDDSSSQTYEPLEVAEGYEPYDTDSNYYQIEKDGLINIGLSPRKNIENHLNLIKVSCYGLDSNLVFVGGEPSYLLRTNGKEENESIDVSSTNALFKPESYEFETYLSEASFQDLIQNHLYDTIKIRNNSIDYFGFLMDLDYNYSDEMLKVVMVRA